jgi:hypothetical protein
LLSYYIIVPLGVLSVMGVGAGISDPGELPELLTGLGIIALTIVLLVAAFFAFAPFFPLKRGEIYGHCKADLGEVPEGNGANAGDVGERS